METKQIPVTWLDGSLDGRLRAARPPVARLLGRVLDGHPLDAEAALTLATVRGPDLEALCRVADELRRQTVGEVVTYVVNRNINFTNVCLVGCSFCGFSRHAGAPDAYALSLAQIVAKAQDAWARGATEVCIQGGLPPGLDGYHYRNILQALKAALPQLHTHAFSPMEIAYGVERTGLPLREYLQMLQGAGLDTMPGTAAEILHDDIRRRLSPNKLPVARWVEIIRTAHTVGLRSTATMMYGHIETPAHWVHHLLLLRDLQQATGGFTEFVPLAFIYPQTRLFKNDRARPGSTPAEDLTVHALARLLFHGLLPHLQVSWVKLGFPMAQACLQAGANDFSGTLMEESISKAAGAPYGEYVAPAEFRALIRPLGRVPAERTTTYQLRRVFPAPEGPEAPPPADASHRCLPGAIAPAYRGNGY